MKLVVETAVAVFALAPEDLPDLDIVVAQAAARRLDYFACAVEQLLARRKLPTDS